MRKKKEEEIFNQKKYEDTIRKRQKIEKDINNILNDLTIEELSELETMGDFSKGALEWIRNKKRNKKAKKAQEDFERNLKCNQDVIRRTVLVGKSLGVKNGMYNPKNQDEKNELLNLNKQKDIRVQERDLMIERSLGGHFNKNDRQR